MLGLLIAYTIFRRLHLLRVLALGLVVGALVFATHAASHIQALGSQRSINHVVLKMRHNLTHDLEHVLKTRTTSAFITRPTRGARTAVTARRDRIPAAPLRPVRALPRLTRNPEPAD